MTNTNTLTLFSGSNTKIALKGAKSMSAAIKDSASDGLGGLPDGGVYISFSGKMGKYSIGTESQDADPNELWLLNVYSFEKGFICWKGGRPVAKRMGSIFEAPVASPDFNEHGPFDERKGEGWSVAKAFMLKSLDRGIQGYFQNNSKSGVRVFSQLEAEVARRLDEELPCWPVVTLDKEKFTAQGQTNFKPIVAPAGWLYMSQVQELAEMESIEDVANAIEAMLEDAQKREEAGIRDTTASGGGEAVEELPDDPMNDFEPTDAEEEGETSEIEDAEIVGEEEEAAPEPEPEKPATTVRRRIGASANTEAPKSTTTTTEAGGMRRRRATV